MRHKIKKTDPAFNQKSLLFRFQKTLLQKNFFKKTPRILIACSGGPDSMAIFHLVRLAFPSWKMAVAHFNHGIRLKTAKRDESFVRKNAKKYGLAFFLGKAKLSQKSRDKKLSLEEAARMKRYEFLKKTCRSWNADAVFFGHHLDDQAETVLMRICQGTGLRGLLGIREQMMMDGMKVIRPLLSFSKSEILNFLRENHFNFCRDETNASTNYLRNRIRLEVLPFLSKKINPRVAQALARLPEIAAAENNFIDEEEKKAIRRVVKTASAKKVTLKRTAFMTLHPAVQFRVLDHLIRKLDPAAGLLFEHGLILQTQLKKQKYAISLPRGVEIQGFPREVLIQRANLTKI